MISDREIRQATEHPRGTEVRRLGPLRDALRDARSYAALARDQRDLIVRWAEIRRLIALEGIDRDRANLADPLLDSAVLRAFVLEGERTAGSAVLEDEGGDLIALVAKMRAAAKGL